MPSLSKWFIDALFSFLSNIIPFARSSSAVASPAPPEAQPFRFLDLPVEIRFMIYSQFAVRFVDVKVPGVDLPGCVGDDICVRGCFHPAMLRVSQQLRHEYSGYAIPRIVLCVTWFPHSTHGENESEIRFQTGRPILPKRVIAQLRYFGIYIATRNPAPHCNYLPTLKALISQLPPLKQVMFSHTLYLDGFCEERLNDLAELRRLAIWRQEVRDFLKSIDDDGPPWKNVFDGFWIDCPSYLPRWTVAERIAGARLGLDIPRASFQILDEEDEDTFRLDGLIVKFRGITPVASLLRTG